MHLCKHFNIFYYSTIFGEAILDLRPSIAFDIEAKVVVAILETNACAMSYHLCVR